MVKVFGRPLAADPAIALKPFPIRVSNLPGPIRVLQYVIELVGPKSVLAASVEPLLTSQWHSALGNPQIFVMGPGDTAWQPFLKPVGGSFDSVALAWDMVADKGELSAQSATHLLQAAEKFAEGIQRRALALPQPDEIARSIAGLHDAHESLDIGFSLAIVPRAGDMPEKDVWLIATSLGLQLDPNGAFAWIHSDWPEPILSLTPLDNDNPFSAREVSNGRRQTGLSLGFNVPRSPDPMAALEACFHIASTFADAVDALIVDDEGSLLDAPGKSRYRNNLAAAVESLTQAGFAPGSAAALILFAS